MTVAGSANGETQLLELNPITPIPNGPSDHGTDLNQNYKPTAPTPDVVQTPFQPKIVWFNAIGFLALYIASVWGLYLAFFAVRFLTFGFTILLMLWAGLSTTVGAHRLFTHRSFKATAGLKFVLIIGQTIAAQNCLWVWVRDHRQHHKYSDTDADPHNSLRGFFFSHVGWLMNKKHPLVIEKGRNIDMTDMNQDHMVMFQKSYYNPLFVVVGILFPLAVPYFLWDETLVNTVMVPVIGRIWVTNNIVWLVNSWAHYHGPRPYDRKIAAIETFWVAFWCLGEGWHNYHHTFPWDYRTSEPGKRPNWSTALIDFLVAHGWAYDCKAATPKMIARKMLRDGDGTHPFAGLSEEEVIKRFELATKNDGNTLYLRPDYRPLLKDSSKVEKKL